MKKLIFFTSILFSVFVAPACSSQSDAGAGEIQDFWAGPDETSPRAGDRTSVLLLKIGKGYEKVRDLFVAPPVVEAEQLALFQASHERWRERFNRCASPQCRYQLAREELNRLNFPLGRSSMPVPSIPFRTGQFQSVEGQGFSGSGYFLPIDGNLVLISVVTTRNEGAGLCHFFGSARLPARGIVRMREIPHRDFPDEQAEIELSIESERELRLRQLRVDETQTADSANYCGALGRISGRYLVG